MREEPRGWASGHYEAVTYFAQSAGHRGPAVCSLFFGLGRGEVGRVALGAKEGVERDGDDVAVLDTVVRVVPADTPLQLESVGDGGVDLLTTGMAAIEDLQCGRAWSGVGSAFAGRVRIKD